MQSAHVGTPASIRLLDQPMTEKTAQAVMAALRAGRTLNSICSKRRSNSEWIEYRSRFLAYCAQHPEYAAEADALIEKNAAVARKQKGYLRQRTHCNQGHSLLDPSNVRISIEPKGWIRRRCLICEKNQQRTAMTPQELRRVSEAVKAGFKLQDITRSTSGRRLICSFAKLKQHRVQHPEFDRFIIQNASGTSRAQLMQFRIVPTNASFEYAAQTIIKPVRKEVPPFLYRDGDIEWISSLIPRGFPGRDDVVQNTFIDLCARAIGRDEVPARIKKMIAEQERLFPTKYRKFGNSQLVSLDEVLFEDGGATRGNLVARGLWD